MPDLSLRPQIASTLGTFSSTSLPNASRELFNALGYHSERTIAFGSVSNFLANYDSKSLLAAFNLQSAWQNIHLIFQLTSEDIAKGSSKQLSLLDPDPARSVTRVPVEAVIGSNGSTRRIQVPGKKALVNERTGLAARPPDNPLFQKGRDTLEKRAGLWVKDLAKESQMTSFRLNEWIGSSVNCRNPRGET